MLGTTETYHTHITVAGVSFAWCVILSVMQGKLDSAAQVKAQATASKLMEQALDGAQQTQLTPVVKPVSAPSFASRPVVAGLQGGRPTSPELRRV